LLYNTSMNVPHKFIEVLSAEDYDKLVENHQTGATSRVRRRAHAILLSFQKRSVDEIADIYQVHRNTVSGWIERWNECGLEGLRDVKQSGRPPILTLEEQAKAVESALKNPKFPHRQLQAILAETGKEISSWTLKRILKKKTIYGKESS